jgi:hypothetical protein
MRQKSVAERFQERVPPLESIFLIVPESMAASRWIMNWKPSELSSVTYSLSVDVDVAMGE